MKHIAIFASGSGTNAENLIQHFKDSSLARVNLVLSNKEDAYVLERARRNNIETFTFKYSEFCGSCPNPNLFLDLLKEYKIDYIVLAGFLLKVPHFLLEAFPNKIINIHPALLPLYGGKGMHGMNVHNAVIAAKEKESGITIHVIDEFYDKGETLAQFTCALTQEDTPESLAAKIHILEQDHFPEVVESYIKSR